MTEAWRIVVRAPGGVEALEREALPDLAPGSGEVLVRTEAAGLNFIDVYHRTGLYPLAYPAPLGSEGAGVVEAIGAGVDAVGIGDRVAWLRTKTGGYATHALVDAGTLFALPDEIGAPTAAATLLKDLTVWMLVERCARVQAGQWILVHAAAGGVGGLAMQWLNAIGARVIAHAGSAAKAEQARALDAEVGLHEPFDALAARVRDITGGSGVAAVFDGVGAGSWNASIASIARCGMMISYGNASGPVPPIAPLELGRAGSLFLTRPTLFDHIAEPALRRMGWQALTDMLLSGKVKPQIGQTYALAEVAEAHRALEARETTGATLLIP